MNHYLGLIVCLALAIHATPICSDEDDVEIPHYIQLRKAMLNIGPIHNTNPSPEMLDDKDDPLPESSLCTNLAKQTINTRIENNKAALRSIENNKVENPITKSFIDEHFNYALSKVDISVLISVAQFRQCQFTINNHISSSVIPVCLNIRDDFEKLLREQKDLIDEGKNRLDNVERGYLNLDGNLCQKSYTDNLEQQLNSAESALSTLKEKTATWQKSIDQAVESLFLLSDDVLAKLKSREDIQFCLTHNEKRCQNDQNSYYTYQTN